MVQTIPLFNKPNCLKMWHKLYQCYNEWSDCINCVLSLINWDDTSGFIVSLFENWIDLYVGTSHFYIEATVIAIYKQILNEIHLTLSHVFIYTQRGWWTKHFTYWHLKLSPQTSLRYLYTRRVKRKNSIILL